MWSKRMAKHQNKKEQKEMDKYLKEKFEEISRGQELIPVVLDRAAWEEIQYSCLLYTSDAADE